MRNQTSTAPIVSLAAAFCLLLTSCVASDNQTPATGPRPTQEESRRTIPEEATTSTVEATTPTTRDAGPLPERSWTETDLSLQPIASLSQPTALSMRSTGDDLWVAERAGLIRLLQRQVDDNRNIESVKIMNTIVLDIQDRVSTEGEGGLLDLTFSSDGRLLYVHYTNLEGNTVVAEYEIGAIAARAETERIILEVEQPYSNHNGGELELGPDGYLYLALGDGGSGGDPLDHGQNTDTLLGSIVRVDPAVPTDDAAYSIPADNPFANGSRGRPEIWLWGVRNPWRFSFDSETKDLWIGDVGQNEIEEITFLPDGRDAAGRGANLGWRILEGNEFFTGDDETELPAAYAAPLFTYDHRDNRCSITGGYVYRGDLLQRSHNGIYIFGDYCTGEIFGLEQVSDGRVLVANIVVDREVSQIVSFGEGPEGELYVLELNGQISRLQIPGQGRDTQLLQGNQVSPITRPPEEDIEPSEPSEN